MSEQEALADAPIVRQYRIPGECDECAIEAAALATGYPDNDYRTACTNEGCRFYDAEAAEEERRLEEELELLCPLPASPVGRTESGEG